MQNPNMSEWTIRPLGRAELAQHLDWAAAEGWNPGLHDAEAFHAADPEGFLLGELRGEPVGMVSAVRYGADFGFIGLYLVRPAWRGRGLGLALWQAAMARLEGRTIGLDGVLAQQANYRRSGFQLAWRNIRYQGTISPQGVTPGRLLRPGEWTDADLLRCDAPFFPGDRRRFLPCWSRLPGSLTLALPGAAGLAGFGTIRGCREGFKIGPLVAETPEGADTLLRALVLERAAGAMVQLDLPEPNPHAQALARAHGMQPVFETARMFTAPVAPPPMERLYGVASFELG